LRMSRHRQNTTSLQRRAFSRTAIVPRDHSFDTLKFVQRLKDEGFTEDQAVSMMKVLSDVIEERSGLLPIHSVVNFSLTLLGKLIVSSTLPEPWSYAKTKRKLHTRKKSTLPNYVPNSSPLTRPNHR
jgi:hypothetical protein